MGLGAILAVRSKKGTVAINAGTAFVPQTNSTFVGTELECVEICGRSLVERIVERIAAIECDVISILLDEGVVLPAFRTAHRNVTIETVGDLRSAISLKIEQFSELGIDHAFINWADTYSETDLLDLFCFHRESRQIATPTFDKSGSLTFWVVDCEKARGVSLEVLLEQAGRASRYFIREYVVRLNHPRDIRQLAADMLRGRCETGPSGRQSRPGVWCDQGADVHRRARIVAPAYIGCGARVRADALITRLSNIERDSCVDSGTVVEDSSVLSHTSVGICLDLCHAVVNGNELFNLERDVVVEVSDPKVMRSTADSSAPLFSATERHSEADKNPLAGNLHPMPEGWQFSGNLVQE